MKYPTLRIEEIISELNDLPFTATANDISVLVSEAADIISKYKIGNRHEMISEYLLNESELIKESPNIAAARDKAIICHKYLSDYLILL